VRLDTSWLGEKWHRWGLILGLKLQLSYACGVGKLGGPVVGRWKIMDPAGRLAGRRTSITKRRPSGETDEWGRGLGLAVASVWTWGPPESVCGRARLVAFGPPFLFAQTPTLLGRAFFQESALQPQTESPLLPLAHQEEHSGRPKRLSAFIVWPHETDTRGAPLLVGASLRAGRTRAGVVFCWPANLQKCTKLLRVGQSCTNLHKLCPSSCHLGG